MNKKAKKLLAILLAVLFVVTLLPSAIAEDETPATPEKELPEGFAGMPEGYVMSEETIAEKQALIEHDVAGVLENMIPGKDYVENEVLVSAASEEEAKTIAAAYNAELVSFNGHFAVLRLSGITVRDAVIAGMNLKYALPPVDPNYIITLDPVEYVDASVPIEDQNSAGWLPSKHDWADWAWNDPLITNPSGNYQYMHDMVNSYAAWGQTTGWSPLVAVIDTGVDYNHEDLNNVQKGYDYADNDSDPMDENGHGTHCAGIIAAELGNSVGGAGIAPNASILAVRVLNASGSGTDAQICNGIYYAANYGADVLSMSLGGYGYSNAKQNAVNYARQQGATVIAAMGNDGTNVKQYPAALDGVIAVASVNPSGERAPYSNYGKWCDIAAPGSDIWSTTPGDNYECWDGTSMATPVVAGAAAMYISYLGHNPGPAAVEKALLAATNKCKSKDCGKGIVDVSKLVTSLGTIGFNVWTCEYNFDYDYYEYLDYRGSSKDLKNAVISPDTLLSFYVDGNDGTYYPVYTLDGSTPSVANGDVKNGIQTWEVLMNEYMPGDKVTLKVMYVNGLGNASRVFTYTFTIAPRTADTEELSDSVVSILAPKVMIPGKTVMLSAALGHSHMEVGYYDLDQNFTWKIVGNSGCPTAKIDAKTGKLTTKAGETGTVTVRATSVKYPSKYQNYTVKVQQINPIGAITLSAKTVSLETYNWATVSVTSLLDNKKNNVAVDARSYRWTSSNPKVAKVMQWYGDGSCELQAFSKGSATLTCEVLDGSGKKVTCRINVTQAVTDIAITGPSGIAAGNSATYKATLFPKGATGKVVWSLESAPSGVTVDSAKGIVKVPASVKSGTILLRAETEIGYNAATFEIKIVPAKASAVTIYKYSKSSSGAYPTVTVNKGAVTAVTMCSMNTMNDSNNEAYIMLYGTAGNGANLAWTCSNTSLLNIYPNPDGSVYVYATGKAGTATLTCTAQDGSNKRATCKVTVVNPVSSIFVQSKSPSFRLQDDLHLAGIGKTASNTVVFGNTYGVPNNKKVSWSFSVYQEVWNDFTGDSIASRTNITSQATNNGWVKISSNGALTVDKKIQSKFDSFVTAYNKYLVIYVNATSQDGTNVTGTARYVVTPLTQKLTTTLSKNTVELKVNNHYTSCYVYNDLGGYYGDYTITSSNPDIAAAIVDTYYTDGIALQIISGTKTGTAKITIKANDGSNKSVTITVKVTK